MTTTATTTNTTFQNNKFNITFVNTFKTYNVNIVTRNSPFLLVVEPKPTTTTATTTNATISNIFQTLTKEKVSLKLVYDDDLESKVNSLKTDPLEYNVYIKDQSSITIETRIQTLSSKHENNLFKIIIVVDGYSLYTESIRCVSKITNTVINKDKIAAPSSPNNTTQTENNNTTTAIEPASTSPSIKTTNSHNNLVKKSQTQSLQLARNTGKLAKTIRKLKKLRQNDKNLITLLYQQNKLITSQLNSVTSIVNTLVAQHNNSSGINNQLSPQSPFSTLPPSPTNSSPPTPESASNTCDANMKIVPQQTDINIPNYQFQIVNQHHINNNSNNNNNEISIF